MLNLTRVVGFLCTFAIYVSFTPASPCAASGSEVRITRHAGRFQLVRNGQPYFIKGAVGWERIEELAEAGGNSIRANGRMLDRAAALGLTVLVNLPMGVTRHGFDYTNAAAVTAQKEKIRQLVLRDKDHPAVLMWALGNELEIFTSKEQRVPVWQAVNDLARMIHQIDGRHPVLTPIGDQYRSELVEVNELCPDLDAVGLNSYVDMLTLPEDVAKQNWTRPYVVTEFGPRGHWQVSRTPWNAPLEDSSTEKAELYRKAYRHAVEDRPQSLGSYVFLWGWKMEKTHTWYGMFLDDGSRLGSVEVMQQMWTGRSPKNHAPVIGPARIRASAERGPNHGNVYGADARLRCSLDASDADGDPLTITWELRRDVADDPRVGGDFEETVTPVPNAVESQAGNQAEIRLPHEPGKYRIFAYARDGKGSAATVNLPVLVERAK